MFAGIVKVITAIVAATHKAELALLQAKAKVKSRISRGKDEEKVQSEQQKQQRQVNQAQIRFKVLRVILTIVEVIMHVIDAVITFIAAHFLLVVAILIVVVIIISVVLGMTGGIVDSAVQEQSVVETGVETSGGYDNITAWTEYELRMRGSNLSNQEKNIYRLIMLFKQYEGNYESGMDVHFTMGQAVSESGFKFYTNSSDALSKNILEDVIDGHIEGNIAKNTYGGLFGTDLAGVTWGTSHYAAGIDKSGYTPKTSDVNMLSSKYGSLLSGYGRTVDDLLVDTFAPYAVQRQLSAVDTYYKQDAEYVDLAKTALERVGLPATDANLRTIRQFACTRISLVNDDVYAEPVYMFYAMLMKAAVNSAGEADMDKWGVDPNIFIEPSMRAMIVGKVNRSTVITSISELPDSDVGYLTLGGKSIGCTLWLYLRNRFGAEEWWHEQETFFVNLYNRAVSDYNTQAQYMLIYNFGITRYMGVTNVLTSITGKLTGMSEIQAEGYGVGELTYNTFALPMIDYRAENEWHLIYSGCLFGYDYLGSGYNTVRFHKGMDLSITGIGNAQMNTNRIRLTSAGAGTVTGAGSNATMGYYVKVLHLNGWETIYMHLLEAPLVAVGDEVNSDTILGYMGSSGMSTGCHLHWQIQKQMGSLLAVVDPRAVCNEIAWITQTYLGTPQIRTAYDFKKVYGMDWDSTKTEGYDIYWSLT